MKYYHSHVIMHERCAGTLTCLRTCPTMALRYRDDSITFFDDLCVDCGACINSCPENVFIPVIDEIADFEKYEFKIVVPSHTLYTQFGANIHPELIHKALLNIGFDAVHTISNNAYELSFVIAEALKSEKVNKPVISNFCPALIRLIQVSYPNLVDLVSQFDVSRELAAKEAKNKYSQELGLSPDKIGVIFISPCPAMVVSIKQPAEKEKSWIDGAIAINDIYNRILPEIIKIQNEDGGRVENDFFYYGKSWGQLGSIARHFDPEHSISVAGIDNVKMILDDIEASKLTNLDYIEAFTCPQGCIGGAYCVENPYIARHTAIMNEKKYGDPPEIDKKVISKRISDNYYTLEEMVIPRTTRSFETVINISIKRMNQKQRILAKLPNKNCGLCGAPSCETFAEDCAWGDAELTDCVFFSTDSK
jgi:Fe-S-cluster-containing hydrogenase component 2